MTNTMPGDEELVAIERVAVELAELAGAEILSSLGGAFSMHYKTGQSDTRYRDPVSEVDENVEELISERLAERFPEHDIIGEESEDRPGRDHDFVWAVDPVDGTANFVNGYPMFAASIGVLFKGRPIVGALWCAASHVLRHGVYHARLGSDLAFDGKTVVAKPNPGVRRKLAGVPALGRGDDAWEVRKTGSAAIECAFAAAGLLEVVRFSAPNIWDVAGGLMLIEAAGGITYLKSDGEWRPFEQFEAAPKADGIPDLRYWRGGIIAGQPDAVRRMCDTR